jgi:hypothetical protein
MGELGMTENRSSSHPAREPGPWDLQKPKSPSLAEQFFAREWVQYLLPPTMWVALNVWANSSGLLQLQIISATVGSILMLVTLVMFFFQLRCPPWLRGIVVLIAIQYMVLVCNGLLALPRV